MHGLPTWFWGKLQKNESGDVISWHPLLDHAADVASVAEQLLSLSVWQRRLGSLTRASSEGPCLSEVVRSRLSVLAALHDLGKFNLGFQAKGRPDLALGTAGHVAEGVAAIFERPICDLLSDFGGWGDGAAGLLVSSICHHGEPHACTGTLTHFQRVHWEKRVGLDPVGGVVELIDASKRWFPKAFESTTEDFSERPELEHAFAGLVMLADWLGSDTRFFAYSEADSEDRMVFSRKMAARAVKEVGLFVPVESRTERKGRSAFERVAPRGFRPRPTQTSLLDLPCPRAASMTILESETGSGKTEAALTHFVRLFESGAVDGLYFALPTRTAATQLFDRVHEGIIRAFVVPPPVILAVPGYLRFDDQEGSRLPDFDVLWPDHERDRFRGWAAEQPKRYLAGSIVVGTIDQVLLSALMVRHAHLRATMLLRHLLVVDEVHASDAYMTRILEQVLELHMRAGGHALLLSATLGAEARTALLIPRVLSRRPTPEEAEATPYPLVTQLCAGRTISLTPGHQGPSREIDLELVPWLEAPEPSMQVAIDAARAGAKVLVIKNTVHDCLEHQAVLEAVCGASERHLLFTCEGQVSPHHARFGRQDREALDRALELRVGKVRREGGCVVVATQTVQQSLDIDADILISDLCPADVLLQRLGRLHRHTRPDRPDGFSTPKAFVVVPENRDLGPLLLPSGRARHHHGLGTVYPDLRVLEATWRQIESSTVWRIPELNRRYVERSIHSQRLDEIARELGPAWQRHATTIVGQERGEGRVADLNLVDWSKPYSECSFSAALDRRITSRLGEGDRRVQFRPAVLSPFGLTLLELALKASWVSEVPSDVFQASRVVAERGAVEFDFGSESFRYDRFGVRPSSALARNHGELGQANCRLPMDGVRHAGSGRGV
ncbi:MAG: CRISPR-associated helicase Cas3' [Deltaproteobacteria bacterium]|nr:CRISPR-associated helicase Cas3' [Deltaproteobacteria bacterium]